MIELIFLIVALVCFVVAACDVPSRIRLMEVGLAFCVAAVLASHFA